MSEESKVKSCWIVTDGTTGMLKQSIAVAKSLNIEPAILPAHPTPILRLFPTLAKIPTWRLTMGRSPSWIRGPYPDYIISCGRRMAGLSIGLRRISKGRSKTIHIQDPGISPDYFDVLVVPSHDRIAAFKNNFSNLVVSIGSLSWLVKKQIMASKSDMIERFGPIDSPQIVVMLGGNNKRYRISTPFIEAMAHEILNYARLKRARLIIIPSRRTPRKAEMIFKNIGLDRKHIFWDGNSENPYPNIFSIADEIIVTSDSVNMVTEACVVGKPVFIVHWSKEQGRLNRFHEIMNERGFTRPLWQAGEKFYPKALNQMPKIAERIMTILNS